AATPKMFEEPDNPGKVKRNLSEVGHLAVAVPGTVAGLVYAQEKYGKLDLKAVMAPAIRLAREGFELNEDTRETNQEVLQEFAENPEARKRFTALYELYLNSGKPWPKAARVTSPQLRVLELIAE